MGLDDEVVDTTLEDEIFVVGTEELVGVDVLFDELETLVVDVETTVEVLFKEVERLVVDDATVRLVDDAKEDKRYNSSLFPAPQYS